MRFGSNDLLFTNSKVQQVEGQCPPSYSDSEGIRVAHRAVHAMAVLDPPGFAALAAEAGLGSAVPGISSRGQSRGQTKGSTEHLVALYHLGSESSPLVGYCWSTAEAARCPGQWNRDAPVPRATGGPKRRESNRRSGCAADVLTHLRGTTGHRRCCRVFRRRALLRFSNGR